MEITLDKNIIIMVIVAALVFVAIILLIVIMIRQGSGDESYKIIRAINDIENNILKDNGSNFEKVLKTLIENLEKIRATNEKKLESIEGNINERLSKSLDQRLNDSFKQIGDQFQNLNKSIGELQSLSTGVNDLQKTLANVKTRGVFGEKQLENILINFLGYTNQWAKQYRISDEENRIADFVIKIPNKNDDGEVLLPIDSKFPLEKYNKIVEASKGNSDITLENAIKEFESAIKLQAKSISEKYIIPPITTDFALMYLPTEGIYSECLRIEGLSDELQSKYKVIIVGPTTVTAIINSFSVGFKYLKISKSSSEINKILQAIKTQYESFGEDIKKAKDRIRLAAESTDKLERRNNTITRKLKSIDALDTTEANNILGIEENYTGNDDEEA